VRERERERERERTTTLIIAIKTLNAAALFSFSKYINTSSCFFFLSLAENYFEFFLFSNNFIFYFILFIYVSV